MAGRGIKLHSLATLLTGEMEKIHVHKSSDDPRRQHELPNVIEGP